MTDYDCPFEEITNFILVSKRLRLQSCRWLGWMYESFYLQRIEWVDERTFIAVIYTTSIATDSPFDHGGSLTFDLG